MSDTIEKVREIIVNQMGVLPDEVTPTSTWASLHMEAPTVGQMLVFVGEEFGVTPGVADLASLVTVSDLVDWIDARVS